MEFSIPKSAEKPLAEFINLSPEQAKGLSDAIRQSRPALFLKEFAAEVASQLGESPAKVDDMVSMFAGMFLARIHAGKSVEDFVADLPVALEERGDKNLIPRDKEEFKRNLRAIISAEDTLGVTAKALDLMTEQEHGLQSVRIITDVRHIFSEDPTKRPKAALVIHTLNLVYHEIDGFKQIYIALDRSDIKELKAAITRAEAKEANIKQLLKETKLDYLESS